MNTSVYATIPELPPASSVVTIGAFDGVHRGHQYLIGRAREQATRINARLVVITFEPLPIQVFKPEVFPGRVLTGLRRRDLLIAAGADVVVELPFSLAMSKVTASEFMEQLMAVGPLRQIWVGADFALGHGREGNSGRLAAITAAHGTEVHAIPRIGYQGLTVSSSEIRAAIIDGQPDAAFTLMGHRFSVSGEVVRGAQLGRQIGFPTANVAPDPTLVPLRDGIYVSYARIDGGAPLPAMTYIGTRPAVNTGQRMIETHLFDFDGDLYGKQVTTEFIRHLRPDADFPSVDALVEQLRQDEADARVVLASMAESASEPS